MKKTLILFGYASLLIGAASLQSCNNDPITPYNGGSTSGVDTTWVDDSTSNNGGNPIDSTNNNGGSIIDSTSWNGGGNTGDTTNWNPGNGDPIGSDTTTWSPDSTNIGG
jgi:hypothetical protein